jgi:integrase
MPGKRGNNEGCIARRSDGLWEARITLPGGKRKSFYAKTRQEAARKLAEAIRDKDKGLPIATDRQTVEQYMWSWMEVMRAKIRPRTWKRYEQHLRVHILPTLGSTTLTKLSAQHLQNLYAAKLAEGLSQTTVRHMHMLLHKALHAALRLELVQRNVSDLVDPPSMARPEMGVLSPEQARALLNAASGNRFEALYVLAVTTGMRLGELLALQWDTINLEQSSLQVRSSLYHTGHEFIFTEPKTAKSRRRVHLPQIAVEALRKHRVLLLEERLALGAAWQTEYDLVFPSTVGGPMDPSHMVRREFARLLKKAGVPVSAFTTCGIRRRRFCLLKALTRKS